MPRERWRAKSSSTRELGDRKERENRLDAEPEAVERLRKMERDYVQSRPAWATQPHKLQIDEIQLNQLRALGYAVP